MLNFTRLKDIRENFDINQEKMSQILKINRSTYSLWELGVNIIPLKSLVMFADYFEMSIDYILGLTNNRKFKPKKSGLDLEILGKNMKLIRKQNGYSQENVAQIIGVTQPAIARYEKGLSCISISNLYVFSKEFKVSIDCLCGR